jgi:hypothetical protein
LFVKISADEGKPEIQQVTEIKHIKILQKLKLTVNTPSHFNKRLPVICIYLAALCTSPDIERSQ